MKRWRISPENPFFKKKEKASGNASLKIKTVEINSVGKCKTRLNTAEKISQEWKRSRLRQGGRGRIKNAETSKSDN